MFCPNCGAQMADDAAFCGSCGTSLKQMPKPVQEPRKAPKAPSAMSSASNEKKVMITMIVSLALILFSILSVFSTAFYNIPFLSMMLNVDGDREEIIQELHEDMSYEIEYMEEAVEYMEDYADDEELEVADTFIKSAKKLRDNFSFNSFKSYMKTAEKVDEDYREVFYEWIDINEDEIGEVKLLLNGITIGVILFFALPILFTVLGGVKKSPGLTITAIVFTAIAQLTVSGVIWFILSLIVGIFQVKICKQIKAEKVIA